MDINSIFDGVASNAIWRSLLGVMASPVRFLRKHGTVLGLLPIARHLREQGVTRFVFSRNDYPERLDAYLERAQHSIKIVSISLRWTNNECALTDIFRRKLASNPSFEIVVSLLALDSNAVSLAAHALNIDASSLAVEISEMLNDLRTLRESLPPPDRGRFHVLTHDSLPMGSAILLDVTPTSGIIQVETKLYRAPGVESFSFEVRGPSAFYQRNLIAWHRIISESKVI